LTHDIRLWYSSLSGKNAYSCCCLFLIGASISDKEVKEMKTKYCSKAIIWLLVLSLVLPMSLKAQEQEENAVTQQPRTYSQEELDRLLAPIALYPDTLLSQVLMASTYPLEVVEADRWLKKNKNLTGDQLDAALQDKSWDVSVKSLCHYPRALAMMSEKLDLTNDLGNAFLGQQDQVMDTIQSLRAKAQAQGNLASTDKQKVIVDQGDITIEPATPDVVYIPAYDPCWVYGPWWYSVCAPPWFWYPSIVIGAGFFFGPPIFIGPLDFWCGFRWHRHGVFINVNKTFFVGRPGITRMHGGTEIWQHNPMHRRGVAYHNQITARKFGQISRPGVDARRGFRGFAPRGGAGMMVTPQTRPERGRGAIQPRSGTVAPGTGRTMRPAGHEPGRIGVQPRGGTMAPGAGRLQQQRSGNALEGFGSSGPEVRQNSERGHESIGGGGRGGGGFHGGGRMR
jgi:predicted secreted protein